MKLREVSAEILPSFVAALEQGWSPRNVDSERARLETLARIKRDPYAFVGEFADGDTAGPPIEMPDGTIVPRLPNMMRWMWDGEFCGLINFRWQPGGERLPPHVLGHVGYTVVPWKRNRGHATAALQGMLPFARDRGLRFIELTTTQDNAASIRTIEKAGGHHVRDMIGLIHHPPSEVVRLYRIAL